MLEAVARARDLPLGRVDTLGRGQIWSGRESVAYGLADRIGGLGESLEEARSLAGIAADEPVDLMRIEPAESTPHPALTRALPLSPSP
jgi:Periplasmic serine proteases (ClpP class)